MLVFQIAATVALVSLPSGIVVSQFSSPFPHVTGAADVVGGSLILVGGAAVIVAAIAAVWSFCP